MAVGMGWPRGGEIGASQGRAAGDPDDDIPRSAAAAIVINGLLGFGELASHPQLGSKGVTAAEAANVTSPMCVCVCVYVYVCVCVCVWSCL